MRKKVYQLIVLDEYGGVCVMTTGKYPSLEELQRIVDGYIEVVRLNRNGNSFLMIVDEDGIFNNKKYNQSASELYHAQIFGPAVLLSEDGEEMAAFTSEEIPNIINDIMFSTFFGENGSAAVII